MLKEDCKDCICLIEDDYGKLICDESNLEIEKVMICPENFD